MIKHLTQNDLLLLAYNELPSIERQLMLSKIADNPDLLKEYTTILEEIAMLSPMCYTPQATSIQIILEESCSSSSLEMI
jgi:hypothetical protein